MKQIFSWSMLLFLFLLLLGTVAEAQEGPSAVSPGGRSEIALIEAICPTFLWTAVDEAKAYELVVYGLGNGGEQTAPILRVDLEGSTFGWTPSLDRCLQPGERYAWSVRATGPDGATEWSPPSLFQVAPGPSARDLERALSLVERYLQPFASAAAEPDATGDSGAGTSVTVDAREDAVSAPAPANEALGGADFSIDNLGNVLATAYGGDGSALTNLDWDHLIDVPAGFADGSDDGIVYVAGNQLDLTMTTFDVVEGSGSDLDADLLDGEHKSYFASQEATYTKTEVDSLLTVGNIDAALPATPTHLRVGLDYRSPATRRLAWNMESLAGVASFVVYQADFPITDGNKQTAQRTIATSLHAPVDLFPGSGMQHFRVEAQNVLGEAGPLSVELVIDTTSRLAYLADQRLDELFELFTIDLRTGTAVRVSDDLITFGKVQYFYWSPDGSRLAYVADQAIDGVFELFVTPATGGGATRVNDSLVEGGDVRSYDFAWSPDGSRLAYLADQETNGFTELFVGSPAGTGTVKINPTVAGSRVASFAWSPDGSRLAYIADQDTDGINELYVASASGGTSTKVNGALVADGDVLWFAWSPDASRLAYVADQETDEVRELYVVAGTGGDATKVNDSLVADGDVGSYDPVFGFSGRAVAWSPDGSRLLYQADQDTDETPELYIVPASGGGSTRIVAGSFWRFAWSPDGTRVAYDQGGDLFTVSTTGGGATTICDPISAGVVFAWRPDAEYLGLATAKDTPGTIELYTAPADGGPCIKLSHGLSVDALDWSPDSSRIAYTVNNQRELYVASAAAGEATQVGQTVPPFAYFFKFGWSPIGVGPPRATCTGGGNCDF